MSDLQRFFLSSGLLSVLDDRAKDNDPYNAHPTLKEMLVQETEWLLKEVSDTLDVSPSEISLQSDDNYLETLQTYLMMSPSETHPKNYRHRVNHLMM